MERASQRALVVENPPRQVVLVVKNPPAGRETQERVGSWVLEDRLEEGSATRSSVCLENPWDGGAWESCSPRPREGRTM